VWDKTGEVIEALKKRFTRELILVTLDLDKKIIMEIDVSDYGTEGVLLIKCTDGR